MALRQPSFPEQVFESTKTEAALQALAAGEIETAYLDFKELPPDADKSPGRFDHVMLAKALSGFANVGGGVLVIGVRDNPRDLRPFANPREIAERINQLIAARTTPPVPNAVARPVPTAADPNRGYVLLLVPESDHGPHMAMAGSVAAAGEVSNRYYMRAGDSFVPMPHQLVADSFGRRPHPVLRIGVRLSMPPDRDPYPYALFFVRNEGRGLARFPLIRARLVKPDDSLVTALAFSGLEGATVEFGLPAVSSRERRAFLELHGGGDHVLHPGSDSDLSGLWIEAALDSIGEGFRIEARLAAGGFNLEDQTVAVSEDDLRLLRNRGRTDPSVVEKLAER